VELKRNEIMEKAKDIKSRRKFVEEGLKLGAGLLIGTKSIIEETSEKVKMLTADGKVVEVRLDQIKKAKDPTKNEDILKWMDNPGVKKSNQ
jgi:hypothetical protein